MRKLGLLFVLMLFVVINTFSQTTIPAGEIKTTTWTKEGSPYYVEGKITVPKENTLTIESGVEIRLDGSFIVNGCLKALGTNMNTIKFTRNKSNGYWGKIIIENSSESVLNYCTIEYCDHLLIDNCSPQIENISINNNDVGIFTKNSNSVLNYCTISNCQHQGILINGSILTIKNTLVSSCSHGICIKGASEVKVVNSNILGNKGLGFDLDGIRAEINNCIIWGNKYAFKSYGRNRTVVSKCIVQKETSATGAENINKELAITNIVGIPRSISDFENIILFNQQASMEINDNSIGILSKENERKTNISSNTLMSVDNKVEKKSIELSDVDENIPVNNFKNKYKYALIIGNEDYTKYQTNLTSEVNVDFAINDAEVFAKYCKNTLGVPDDNIFLLKNAIGTEMKREINKMAKMMMYTQGKAEVIFYYAGHGIPHETTKESYLMPVDVSAQNIEDGVKLSWVYSKLTEYDAKHVLVFLDACFTGGARNQGLLAARGVKIKPKDDIITGNCVAFTSSSDIQSSLPYKEKQHGMFTYHLLKKLQETKGNITLGELSDYLYENVALSSLKINSKEQTPKTLVSPSLKDDWKEIRLNE